MVDVSAALALAGSSLPASAPLALACHFVLGAAPYFSSELGSNSVRTRLCEPLRVLACGRGQTSLAGGFESSGRATAVASALSLETSKLDVS